jgi:hypothetical protein
MEAGLYTVWALRAVALLASTVAAAAACSHYKPATKLPQGKIVLEIAPPEAKVYIDERLQGTADMLSGKPLLISHGKHRLKVVADRYFPKTIEFTVTESSQKIKVDMTKIPPPLYP